MDSLRDRIIKELAPLFLEERAEAHEYIVRGGGSQVEAGRYADQKRDIEASFFADAILKLIEPRGESELREALEKIADPQPTFAGPQCCQDTFEDACELFSDIARQALATPSAPVSGLVAEIDALLGDNNLLDELPWKHLKSGDEIRPDAPNAVAQLNALLTYVNAWPRIKSALASRDEWRPITPKVIDELASSG
jgi:hypothetical protein